LEKEYKFGIIAKINSRHIGICSCGQHLMGSRYQRQYQCELCGNEFFISSIGKKGRFVIPYLEIIKKDNRGFKVKRTNLSIVYKDGFVKPIQENLSRTMEYDIVDKVLKVWRNDELEYDYSIHKTHGDKFKDANKMFFIQLEESVFLEFISNDVTRELYTSIVHSLARSGWNKKNNTLRGLADFMHNYSHFQILANAGIPEVDRFFKAGDNRERLLDEKKTKPHEILKMPKFMMSYIREDVTIDRFALQQFQGQLNNLDNNKFRQIMSVVNDESNMKELANSLETIMNIHVDYDYTNLNKLILYLFREVRLTQGMESPQDASTYLRDYIRMSSSMGLEWEKYPKSLKKEHDIVQLNYKVVNAGKESKELFKFSVNKNSYKKLAFQSKKHPYAIVLPQTSEDLTKEGKHLSHCVASYVKDVTNDKCKILFLRDVNDIEEPLATIEVRGLNIRQAKGKSNQSVNQEQKEFIKFWAEENNLVEAYY